MEREEPRKAALHCGATPEDAVGHGASPVGSLGRAYKEMAVNIVRVLRILTAAVLAVGLATTAHSIPTDLRADDNSGPAVDAPA